LIKRALQRIAHATGAAVGVVHHTGWDDSRERGSSRQRQALDVVMQIKDHRITNIKQKYGQKFEPIMFTVDEALGTGSIYVRLSTQGEQLREAFESIKRGQQRGQRGEGAGHYAGQSRDIEQQDCGAASHPEIVLA
jgi:hypothetical protein